MALRKPRAISSAMELEWLLSYKSIVVGAFLALFVIYERVRPATEEVFVATAE